MKINRQYNTNNKETNDKVYREIEKDYVIDSEKERKENREH